MAQHQFHKLAERVYDPETGHGGFECVGRQDGRFDLVIYLNSDDLSVYGLTRNELADIGRRLQSIAADAEVAESNS